MRRLILLVAILLTLLLSACGAQATPTISPVDVQNTAIAAAFTMVAQTQASIPTATPLPPTETPAPTALPTNTLPPLPTLDLPTASSFLQPTTAPTSSGGDNCVHPLDMGEAGPKHKTLVKNQSGGSANLSLNLYTPNAFGQCGAISYSLGKNESVMAELPSGYWFAYAWLTLKGNQSTSSGSFFVQPSQFDKLELCIRKDNIIYGASC